MSRIFAVWMALLLGLFGRVATAAPENPFRTEGNGVTLAPGAEGKVSLTLIIPRGFHVYRDMAEVKVDDAGGLKFGEPDFPTGVQKEDPASPGTMREQFEEDLIVEVPVTAPATAGVYNAAFLFRFQGCKETLCYMPKTDRVEVSVTVPATGVVPDIGGGAQAPAAAPVEFKAGPESAGHAVIAVHLNDGWHINRDLFSVRLAEEEGPLRLGSFELPAGKPFSDPATGFSRTDIEEDFALAIPVTGPAGQAQVALIVNYQACKEGLCQMPTDAPITVSAALGGVAAAPAAAPAAADPAPAPSGDALSRARSEGVLPLLVLVFVAGLGVSLTPCVLPMVPITIGIIGARSAGSRIQAVSLAGAYVLGLALVYTSLGVAAGLSGKMFGSWMQSPWMVGGVAVFFFAMGLAMFGLFDLGMPSSVQTKLASYGGSGYGGAFVVGMVGALVAGPCSGPVLLSIVALIGQKGELALGAALMAVFSLGMGMIFLVAGAFSSTLLRPGAWMDTVKKSFGLIMWAGAVYFSYPHLQRIWEPLPALVAAAMLLTTAVFAWPASEEDDGFWVARARKLYSLVGGIVGAYLLVGLLVTQGFLLPKMGLATASGSAPAATAGIVWGTDEAGALAKASAEGRAVMIDFTADWCAACKELEHYTYSDARVVDAAREMVAVKIDMTVAEDPKVEAMRVKYEVGGLPKVVFLTPDGTVLPELTVTGFEEADIFLPKVQAAQAAAQGS